MISRLCLFCVYFIHKQSAHSEILPQWYSNLNSTSWLLAHMQIITIILTLAIVILWVYEKKVKPLSPQATVCCYVGAAVLVYFRPGWPGLPNRGFKKLIKVPLAHCPQYCQTWGGIPLSAVYAASYAHLIWVALAKHLRQVWQEMQK